jgi:translocation and assembly module TamB
VGVLQGFVTETGLNFIMSLDYNKFSRELKSKKRKEKERQEKRATKKQ